MTIREIRTFNSKIRKLERLSEQYLNSKIKIEIENKRLKQKLKNTRKALEIIKKEMSKETMPDFAVIHNALKTALEQKD